MRFFASLRRAVLPALALAVLCVPLVLLPLASGLAAHAADAVAVPVVAATAAPAAVIPYGDMLTALIAAAGGPLVIMAVIVNLGMRLLARVNAPLAAAAEAAGADRLIETAGAHAIATTANAIAGKTLELHQVPDTVARMVNFAVTYGPDVVNQMGGTAAVAAHAVAWLSKAGMLPPETDASTFKS